MVINKIGAIKKRYFEISNKKKVFLRFMANFIDSLFIIIFLLIFKIFIGESILISMFYSSLIAISINVLSIFVFPKNGSLGLYLTRMGICNVEGGKIRTLKLILRQTFLTLYWIPFLNLMLIITNIASLIIYKNNYIHDFIMKTQIESIYSVFFKEKGTDEK